MTATLPGAVGSGGGSEPSLRRALERELANVGAEADGLRADLDAVLADQDDLRADLHRARAELDVAMADRAAAVAELERLAAERDAVAAARDEMVRDRDAVVADRALVQATLEALVVDRAAVAADRDVFAADRDAVAADRAVVVADRDALLAERESLLTDRAAVVADRDRVRVELQWQIDRQQDRIDHQQERLSRMTDEQRQLARAAAAHHRRRVLAAADGYQQDLQDQARRRTVEALRVELHRQHDLAFSAETERLAGLVRAGQLAFELNATQRTFSWRITRSLRAVRRASLKWRMGRRGPVPAPLDLPRPSADLNLRLPDAEGEILDLDHYRLRHADLAHLDDWALLDHFHRHGRREGRIGSSWLRRSLLSSSTADDRERVLVVLPAGGCALGLNLIQELGAWYHVVGLLQGDGELAGSIGEIAGTTVVLDDSRVLNDDEAAVLAREVHQTVAPRFAVTVSAGCHRLAIGLEDAGIPVVAVVSENASSIDADQALDWFFASVSELVHPGAQVAASMVARYGAARGRGHTLAEPGRTDVPDRTSLDQASPGAVRRVPDPSSGPATPSSMAGYAELVDRLGRQAAHIRSRQDQDLRTILVPDGFDHDHYTGGEPFADREGVARHYLRRVQVAAPLIRPNSGILLHRPRPGFHPLVYAESAPDYDDTGRDPFAHYLRSGRPAGRWVRRLITQHSPAPAAAPPPTVLVHGHFHYPELLPDFLDLLGGNSSRFSLALTTSTARAADELTRIAADHPAGTDAEVLLLPNRGRNLSALLSGPIADRVRSVDLVLHVHGKRSPHIDPEQGRRWREHLWSHLVGDGVPLADRVVAEFAAAPGLGIVAPEDRALHDWYTNREHAVDLLTRIGRTTPLPVHFDFPAGAMFWARSTALLPLLDARLDENDYPAEPLGPDGTWLHALERIIPLIVEEDGCEYAKTHLVSSAQDPADRGDLFVGDPAVQR